MNRIALFSKAAQALIACVVLLLVPASARAWEPSANELDAALTAGDLTAYFTKLSAWINEKAPAAGAMSDAALKTLVDEPGFRNALDQRQFIYRHGAAELGAFVKADPANKTFVAWFLKNTRAMDLYLEATAPGGVKNREANTHKLNVDSLAFLKKIIDTDPEAKEGVYLKLAMAIAHSAPFRGESYGSGIKIDRMERYQQYKTAHKNKELFPSFDNLSVWDMFSVVDSWASDKDLVWVRQMIATWRPDLRSDTKVISIVSEVWRRFSPFPFSEGFVSVLAGGGKCGPRSWFGEMACKAHGLPSHAMGQPAHSAVAYKSPDPSADPQPGCSWKICHGRGWHVTDGGYGLLTEAAGRDRVELFSEIEHLTWLASTLGAKDRVEAVLTVVHKLQDTIPKPAAGPNPAIGPNGELIPLGVANLAKPLPPPKDVPEAPFEVKPGVIHVEAETFTKSLAEPAYPAEQKGEVFVLDCATGGKQVNFQRNMKENRVEYAIDVPATGAYALEMRVAAVNFDQMLDVSAGETKLGTVKLPSTKGLWGTTPPIEIKLEKGKQTLRISAANQRGIAIRWFELKAK